MYGTGKNLLKRDVFYEPLDADDESANTSRVTSKAVLIDGSEKMIMLKKCKRTRSWERRRRRRKVV